MKRRHLLGLAPVHVTQIIIVPHHNHHLLIPYTPPPRICSHREDTGYWGGKENLTEEIRVPGLNITSAAVQTHFNTKFHSQIHTRKDERELYTRLLTTAYLRHTSLPLTDHVAQLFNNSSGPSLSFFSFSCLTSSGTDAWKQISLISLIILNS